MRLNCQHDLLAPITYLIGKAILQLNKQLFLKIDNMINEIGW